MNVITLHNDQPINAAGLVWEDPPQRKKTGKYGAITAALRERPGRWAVVRTLDSTDKKQAWSFSNTISSGKLIDFRSTDGRFEAVCRSTNGESRVYVRYLPAVVAVSA